MKRVFSTAGFLALWLTSGAPASAQVADHLKCYKIKDPQARIPYTADLDGLVPEPGCTIKVPATLACVPATKTNVTPTPPGGGGTGRPNSFFCYKVRCPRTVLPTLAGQDQFGSRTVTPKVAKLLCAPLVGPPTTSTSTSTTTSSTTTTPTTSTTTSTARFVDNGDGTVTDHQTGLQWEQKDNTCPGLHCVNDTFIWSTCGTPNCAPDGPAFTSFLNTLNGGTTGVGNCVSSSPSASTGGFNNHCDWRLPTIVELRTILLAPYPCGTSPCLDPVFGPTAAVVDPPPLDRTGYWSSTTAADGNDFGAWVVDFSNGLPFLADKVLAHFSVRAVRGGR